MHAYEAFFNIVQIINGKTSMIDLVLLSNDIILTIVHKILNCDQVPNTALLLRLHVSGHLSNVGWSY